MKVIVTSLIVFLFFPNELAAQHHGKITIDVQVQITGDRAKVYDAQFKSSIYNELARIPDVEQVSSGAKFVLYLNIFELPCHCEWFDFHYRAHFIPIEPKFVATFEPELPIEEGFKSFEDVEALSKDIVATLNAYSLKHLRK